MQETEDVRMHVVVVTGMSGSGKSVVMDVLEDIGYYCIDNLPPQLMGKFVDICRESENHLQKLAIAADLRSGDMFTDAYRTLLDMERQPDLDVKILYIEAEDEVIIKRYKETRRLHPLMKDGSTLENAIARERELLAPVRNRASAIIDTSNLSTGKLRGQLIDLVAGGMREHSMDVRVVSFGFKYGLPLEADLVFDVRFLPNPYYIPELKQQTGLDEPVKNFVFKYQQTLDFVAKTEDLLSFLLPNYLDEGKTDLVIAVGCTGGKHRSVCIAKELFEFVSKKGYAATLSHRDMGRR